VEVVADADAETGQAPQTDAGPDARLHQGRQLGRLRRVRPQGARARLDHEPPDRGRPRRDDSQDQARREGLDQRLPRQAVHEEARGDANGLRQGQPGGLGRRRKARARHVRARRRSRGPRSGRDSTGGPQAADQEQVREARGGGGVKGTDAHALDDHDLVERLKTAREEAFNLRFRHATGELENTAALGAARRDVARLLTVAGQRGIDLDKELSR